ncbi:finger RFP-like [Podarcis lilfordi]|uniref:Finger RFP-like n=1 Tax=Podarcis lilfordi TaxID=74358 RepID=A0AA35JZH9_9SAUR|nr:finger RFP-like [Podarcis lilfordi]
MHFEFMADEMADESPVQNLCEETTCRICREYFKDPVIIECGHNFCQSCITETWGESDGVPSCPQCREPCQQKNVRPNQQLASIVEIVKKFSLQMARGAEALGRVCERHQEPLKLFGEGDQAPICVVCDKSKEHKVIPKEEAFDEYQGRILRHLEFLKEQREEILSSKLKRETESQYLLKQTDMERQKLMADFKQLHQFLEEQEHLLLAQLKELDDEIKSWEDKHIAKLSQEMSSIDDLIKELEEKQKQPATEFLQNTRSILERCNENENKTMDAFPPGLKDQIDVVLSGSQDEKADSVMLSSTPETIQQGEMSIVRKKSNVGTFGKIASVNIVLDPETANHYLILSEDRKSVRCGGERQNLPESRKRFDPKTYVLGSERFRAVRKWWEVEVGGEKNATWAVGVARDSTPRKGQVSLKPSVGIWAVGKAIVGSLYGLWAFTAPERTPLLLNHELRKIRVTLDCERGSVGFFDVEGDVLIFTFPNASFFGEEIRPFFLVGQGAELSC